MFFNAGFTVFPFQVSELIGLKTVVNEFVAYESLGQLKSARIKNEKLLSSLNGNYSLDYIKDLSSEIGKSYAHLAIIIAFEKYQNHPFFRTGRA